ncbi:MAG: putative toxin-antitoxin system toxin component, PIN family [Bacteroidia bacterium]
MRVVIDTNIILISFSERSQLFWISQALNEGLFTLCVSTEILLEYEEILTKNMGSKLANIIMDSILGSTNVKFITTYYKWNLIATDVDDNKFIDCAIAAEAKYLVTEDKHFNILKTKPFHRVEVVSVKDFKKLIIK